MPRLERRKSWYDGQMTLEKAALLRLLKSEGANPLHLAMAFGVSYALACLIANGKAWTGQQCRDCWRLLVPTTGKSNGVCGECMKQRCGHCGGPKPESRKSHRCRSCDRENFQNVIRRTGHCRECGEELPETRRNTLCCECVNEDARFRQQFRNNENKPCRECGEPIPTAKSWTRTICRACAKKHDALRRALSRRYCGICGKERQKDEQPGALCIDCRRDDDRIRKRGTYVSAEEHMRSRQQQEKRNERVSRGSG